VERIAETGAGFAGVSADFVGLRRYPPSGLLAPMLNQCLVYSNSSQGEWTLTPRFVLLLASLAALATSASGAEELPHFLREAEHATLAGRSWIMNDTASGGSSVSLQARPVTCSRSSCACVPPPEHGHDRRGLGTQIGGIP